MVVGYDIGGAHQFGNIVVQTPYYINVDHFNVLD